jgi:hypothetical protein
MYHLTQLQTPEVKESSEVQLLALVQFEAAVLWHGCPSCPPKRWVTWGKRKTSLAAVEASFRILSIKGTQSQPSVIGDALAITFPFEGQGHSGP